MTSCYRTPLNTFVLAIICTLSLWANATTLLEEKFDSTGFGSRGWFDSTNLSLNSSQHIVGSLSALELRYLQGAITPASLPSPARHVFTASEAVYVRYYVKYSDNWQGSNKPYHPHELYLLTTADDRWIGPGNTHFTAYIEQNEGLLQLSMQDSLNIDSSKIGVDLTNVTENRGVAGCNGNPDGVGSDCYNAGTYRNGKSYRSAILNFGDTQGLYYKGNWHKIEAYLKFNSVINGKGQADGVMQLWQNGTLVVDRRNIIMRTAANATMKFNSILIGPWIGDGSPVDQTTWIDDLLVSDTNLVVSPPMPPKVQQPSP
jgi:hypothetical protein